MDLRAADREKLQNSLNALSTWADENDFRIYKEKLVQMVFIKEGKTAEGSARSIKRKHR
jgi:hypothetical protein